MLIRRGYPPAFIKGPGRLKGKGGSKKDYA